MEVFHIFWADEIVNGLKVPISAVVVWCGRDMAANAISSGSFPGCSYTTDPQEVEVKIATLSSSHA